MKDIYTKMELGCINAELDIYYDKTIGICSPCPTSGDMLGCLMCDDKD